MTGRQGDFVDFALDEPFSLRIAPEDRGDPVRILFFARPGLKRRGYELGVEALRRFHERRPDADIVLFGAREEELGSLPFPARNLGVLDAAELAAAMNEAHVLLSFSLTNISNVPFEGMACGCAVLEADVPTVTEMVAPGSCLLASPDPESVAAQLERLAADAELRHGVARRGAAEMEGRTWQRTGDQFERVLLDACFVRLGGGSPRRPAGGLAAHGQTAG